MTIPISFENFLADNYDHFIELSFVEDRKMLLIAREHYDAYLESIVELDV